METINSESYQNSNLVTDLDNFRGRNLETDRESGLSVLYPSCEIYAYEQNLFRLIAESRLVRFKPKWTMRPDYASFDMYGSVIHWPLLLFVNDVYSLEDFKNLYEILVPPISLIAEMIRDRVPRTEISQLDAFIPIPGISMFQRKPFDDIEKNKLAAKNSILDSMDSTTADTTSSEPVMVEMVDQFTLTDDDVSNKYVELSGLPINYSCVSLYIGDFTIPQKYGYEYVLTPDADRLLKRITWDPSKCFFGKSTMDNVLKTSVKIKVKYLQESTGT